MDTLLQQGLELLSRSDPDAARYLGGNDAAAVQEKLERYIAEIELFNAAYGLVGVKTREELIIKHILDSLAPLGPIVRALESDSSDIKTSADDDNDSKQLADAGSGAGLPGIPLAIALPRCNITLIERMGRRVGFLQNTQALLGLKNISIEQKEVEKAAPGRYDLVCFRAFRPLEAPMLQALFKLLKPDGQLAAYKARLEKIEEELAPVKDLYKTHSIIETPVPFLEEERRLVLLYR